MLGGSREAALPWKGAPTRNSRRPTAPGTPKPCCLAPASMTAGDLSRPEPIVLCGFTGYQDFAPELAAANLKRQWGAADVPPAPDQAPRHAPHALFTALHLPPRPTGATLPAARAAPPPDHTSAAAVPVGL